MKRYISKERPLTPEEQLKSFWARVEMAQDELRQAFGDLEKTISDGPPKTTTEYIEVKPGEPGYEDAPFENSIIMDSRDAIHKIANQPSPWIEMVERGKYPDGLASM